MSRPLKTHRSAGLEALAVAGDQVAALAPRGGAVAPGGRRERFPTIQAYLLAKLPEIAAS